MLTLLLDLTRTWETPQRQALALACALRRAGRFAPLICCPADAPLARRAREADLPVLPLSGASPRNPLSLFRLWNRQRRQRILLVHTFGGDAPLLGWFVRRMRAPGRTILLHSRFTPHALEDNFRSRVWQEADKILCCTSFIAARLRDGGLDPAVLPVIRPGLRQEEYPPRRPRGDGRFAFVTTGALTEPAGHSVLVKAMAALWQRTDLPPWEVRIVGEGPLFRDILEEAHALGVESRLALLGAQREGDVLPLCDALVTPFTGPQGALRTLAAGWLTGLPVICTTSPVHLELARPDDTVLTVAPGDPQELASAMIRLMLDRQRYDSLTLRGLSMASRVTEEHTAQRCLELYADGIARRGWVLPPAPDGAARADADPTSENDA
ncbi:MAG: glycosyltransferase family 4 protein [Desulfovibrionaceae bacterium]|nr:glycosyltransferase family 4 protein [Desulfovibrionaceae bacterium]